MDQVKISAEDLACFLWKCTATSAPDILIDNLANGGFPKADRDRVEREILLYRMFVVDFWLQQCGYGELHGPKAFVVQRKYIALSKETMTNEGIADEDFLAVYEERSAAHERAQTLWIEGMEAERVGKARPPESVLPRHEVFARFCGVEQLGPTFLLAFTLEMDRFSKVVLEALEYEIECSQQEVADVAEVLSKAALEDAAKQVRPDLSSEFGCYRLGGFISDISGLKEFSALEYEVFGRPEGETGFNAPAVEFLGRSWNVDLGARNGVIYKIAPYLDMSDCSDSENIDKQVLEYCQVALGTPSSLQFGVYHWRTPPGNVILQTSSAAAGLAIALFITAEGISEPVTPTVSVSH